MLSRVLVTLVVAGAVGFAAGFISKSEAQEDIQWVAPERQPIQRKVLLNGIVSPEARVAFTPTVGGRVDRIFRQKGDSVRIGDAILRVDSPRSRLELLRRQIALQKVTARIRQANKSSSPVDNTPEANIQLDLLDEQLARAEYDDAARTNSESTLRATAKGVLSQQPYRVGDSVSGLPGAGAPIVIVSNDQLRVEIEADEFDVAEIRGGQKALVYREEAPGTAITGRVSADPSLRRPRTAFTAAAFEVTISLESSALRMGSAVRAEVVTESAANVVVVPLNALITERSGSFGVIQKNSVGTLRFAAVSLGLTDNKYAEARGVVEGDHVATGAADALARLRAQVR